ncbi:DUF4253 domain-containing protein [Modestobacter sp. VKM Ac-2983]|uniref:DUF4253 domain-containing protein n=1 Tax=Modestobacter sp. VKM Ac-2983 TaxID=3004137 RepID=UPI0022AB9ECE|nr:DUF4253 domain-containing protein [Modestobacter sp. VKM Ac-2983]MCZ2804889.1 DUF4253 domain-containing protein [Modestobacter sp. VKM Ac-2983]
MSSFRLSEPGRRSFGAVIDVPGLLDPETIVDIGLPPVGTLTLGRLRLPAGRPARAGAVDPPVGDVIAPALCLTDEPVSDAAVVWRLLVDRFPATGLWPVVLRSLAGTGQRPWNSGELQPVTMETVDGLDALSILAQGWADSLVPIGGLVGHPEIERALAPYGAEFPGLAAAPPRNEEQCLLPATVLGWSSAARIGLVRCRRPADAVAAIGWLGTINWIEPAQVAAVLRSWEDRFGAVLASLDFATLTLLVRHPPQTVEQALPLAAEIAAFCPDEVRQGTYDSLRQLSGALVGRPYWRLWFD